MVFDSALMKWVELQKEWASNIGGGKRYYKFGEMVVELESEVTLSDEAMEFYDYLKNLG